MNDKCAACSFETPDGAPVVASSPYLTALAQVAVVGDVERVASWMCDAHREDFKTIVETLRAVPSEAWPAKRTP